jgi:hypothetical protein
MLIKKIYFNLKGKKILTFWLIFLNCIIVYPIRVEIHHKLFQIDPNIEWQNQKESIKQITEYITFYLFDRKSLIDYSNPINFEKNYHNIKDCKKKNDLIINYFLFFKKEALNKKKSNKDILNLQNYALDLLQTCNKKNDEYIQNNAKNIIYWLSLYVSYHSSY